MNIIEGLNELYNFIDILKTKKIEDYINKKINE